MPELIERWWNGRYGRLARRDMWCYKEVTTTWRVECRKGDADSGKTKTWNLTDENDARALVQRLLDTGGDGWIDLNPGTGHARSQP
jgi:hypothetical protein